MKTKPDYFAVAYCQDCGCISAMAWATTPKDCQEAIKDLAKWAKEQRRTAVITKKRNDPMPMWCGCELTGEDDTDDCIDADHDDDSWHELWERDHFGDS